MVLKRCTISLLSRHLGLEESEITGHSNKREKIARLSRRVPKGSELKTRITNAWSQEEIDLCSLWAEVDDKHRRKIEKRRKDYRILKPNFHLLPFLWKEKEITGLSNSTCIRLCSRHGSEKVKPQGRKWYQMLFHFLKRSKKLNYRVLKNTDRTQSLWWFGRKSNCNDMILKQAIGSERFGRE